MTHWDTKLTEQVYIYFILNFIYVTKILRRVEAKCM